MFYHISFLLLCISKPITLVIVGWAKSLFHLCDFHFNMFITNHFLFLFCGFYFDACTSCLVFTSTLAFLCFCFLFSCCQVFLQLFTLTSIVFSFTNIFLLFQYLLFVCACVDIIFCIHHSLLWFIFCFGDLFTLLPCCYTFQSQLHHTQCLRANGTSVFALFLILNFWIVYFVRFLIFYLNLWKCGRA